MLQFHIGRQCCVSSCSKLQPATGDQTRVWSDTYIHLSWGGSHLLKGTWTHIPTATKHNLQHISSSSKNLRTNYLNWRRDAENCPTRLMQLVAFYCLFIKVSVFDMSTWKRHSAKQRWGSSHLSITRRCLVTNFISTRNTTAEYQRKKSPNLKMAEENIFLFVPNLIGEFRSVCSEFCRTLLRAATKITLVRVGRCSISTDCSGSGGASGLWSTGLVQDVWPPVQQVPSVQFQDH